MKTRQIDLLRVSALLLFPLVAPVGQAAAQEIPRFQIELEAGPVWQSRNDVQIPNDETGTRFSLVDLAGNGPWAAGRLYFTWNFKPRQGLDCFLPHSRLPRRERSTRP